MTPAEIVARAMSQVGRPIRYELGAGGRRWDLSTPAPSGVLDCSGLANWARGADRGRWNTDAIYADANGRQEQFCRPLDVQPGDFCVYKGLFETTPVLRRIRPGHIGIVVDTSGLVGTWAADDADWRAIRVVHCSMGNWKRFGFAVAESDGSIWRKRGIVVRAR